MYIYINNSRIGLNNILPAEWLQVSGSFNLGFSVFYIHTRQDQVLNNNPTRWRYQDYFFLMFSGVFEYPANLSVFNFPGEQFSTSVQNIKSKNGLILVCFKKSNIEIDNNILKQDIGSISVILSLHFGSNLIKDQIVIGTTIFELHSHSNYSVTSAIGVQILDFNLSGVNINLGNLQNIGTLINAFEISQEKNKIELCTNWYLKSFSLSDLDNFIAKWIALETLCMEESSNIYPIKQLLGEIYNMKPDHASSHFCIGRIYGLRSEIVHNGHLITFKPAILEYLGHIIEDCLHKKLGSNSLNLAQRTLDNFDMSGYLDQVYTEYIR